MFDMYMLCFYFILGSNYPLFKADYFNEFETFRKIKFERKKKIEPQLTSTFKLVLKGFHSLVKFVVNWPWKVCVTQMN